MDVADPDSARAMAEAAVDRFGGLDYLVNNAAIFGGMQLDLLLTVDWEYLNRFLSVNMLGALNCVRACYPAMKARGGGAIVNQSSTAAYLYAGFYGLAKAGVNSLTQQLAHELGGQNIRINAIAPGPIDTEASRTVVPDAFMQPILAGLALKRQGVTHRPGGDVPLPPVRRGVLDHRPRVQRRRRPGGPPVRVPPRTVTRHDRPPDRRRGRRRRAPDRLRPPRGPQRLRLGHVPGRGPTRWSMPSTDDPIHAVVLTGRGEAFTSGQDLREMAAIATGDAGADAGSGFQRLLDTLVAFDKPLLAAVHGVGMGLGCTLLGHVDLVLMERGARLRAPFAEMGVPPEAASSWLLPERMGWQRASALLLASEWIDADQAVSAGLALRVCDEGTVVDETLALARSLAAFPPQATRRIKRLMTAGPAPGHRGRPGPRGVGLRHALRRPRGQPRRRV